MRRTDAQIAAVLSALALPIQSSSPIIERPDADSGASEVTDEHLEFARKNCFHNIDFAGSLKHMMSAFWAGYAWFEKIYKLENQKLELAKLAPRLATTLWSWNTNREGELEGITQRVIVDRERKDVVVPRNKLALFTVGKEGDDFGGISILRPVYKHYLIKDALYKLDAVRLERYAIGVPVFTLPEEHTDAHLDLAKEMGKNWRGAEQSYAIMVDGMTVNLLQMSNKVIDMQPTIKHHNEEIAKSTLAQFINLGTTDS